MATTGWLNGNLRSTIKYSKASLGVSKMGHCYTQGRGQAPTTAWRTRYSANKGTSGFDGVANLSVLRRRGFRLGRRARPLTLGSRFRGSDIGRKLVGSVSKQRGLDHHRDPVWFTRRAAPPCPRRRRSSAHSKCDYASILQSLRRDAARLRQGVSRLEEPVFHGIGGGETRVGVEYMATEVDPLLVFVDRGVKVAQSEFGHPPSRVQPSDSRVAWTELHCALQIGLHLFETAQRNFGVSSLRIKIGVIRIDDQA